MEIVFVCGDNYWRCEEVRVCVAWRRAVVLYSDQFLMIWSYPMYPSIRCNGIYLYEHFHLIFFGIGFGLSLSCAELDNSPLPELIG